MMQYMGIIGDIMAETGEITLTNFGKKRDLKWKMDFPSLSKEDGAYYWSPEFSFKGESWYLGMYPNGNKYWNSSGFIHLCLLRSTFKVPPITVEFTFSIKTKNGQKVLKTRRTGDFKEESYKDIKQFISTSDFEKRQSKFLVSGSLTLVCTLKIITSTGSASGGAVAGCSNSKRNLDSDTISPHKKKCINKPLKCPHCSVLIDLQNLHDSQMESVKGSLSEDLKSVLLDGTNHDIILKIQDKELRAHRDILKARSQVFKSMLSHDMMETNSGVIDIPDCDPEAMEQFLLYVYCGKVEKLDQSNMTALYYIADKYEKRDLKEICSEFIKKSLSPTNLCKVVQLAMNHSDCNLLDLCTEYLANNLLDILRSVEWQSFFRENPTVANELLIKSQENKK